MICKIIDDVFDELYLHEFYELLTHNVPYSFSNVANRRTFPYGHKGSHKLLGSTLFARENLNRITVLDKNCNKFFDMFEMIENILDQKFYLSMINVNLQYCGCDGTIHNDGQEGEYTIMVMTNPSWEKSWGGNFQIVDSSHKVVEDYEYIPGRILVFPSEVFHRGLGPLIQYVYRTTVVFRVSLQYSNES
jgi:hypothetical protein